MKKSGLVFAVVPCLLAIAPAAFAQDAATTTTNTTVPAGAAATMPSTTTDAATTTTTTTTATPVDTTVAPTTLPRTGGDPESIVLLGMAVSGGMLALRRRFAR